MRHVGQEVTLGFVRGVGGLLFEHEELSFIFPLLLIRIHLFHALVDLALVPVTDDVEYRYERENKKSYKHAHGKHAPRTLEQRALLNHYRQMPLVKDLIHKDGALLSVDDHLEIALLGAHHRLIELFPVRILAVVLALLTAVLVGNNSAVVIQDKTISVARDLDIFHRLLHAREREIQA